MRIFGCLGYLLFFFFLIGIFALVDFWLSLRRVFKGGGKPEQPFQKPADDPQHKPEAQGDYHFQSGDGEYVDFEEVKDDPHADNGQ